MCITLNNNQICNLINKSASDFLKNVKVFIFYHFYVYEKMILAPIFLIYI